MKNLTWQNPEQLFVAQELINKVKSKCCGIKDYHYYDYPAIHMVRRHDGVRDKQYKLIHFYGDKDEHREAINCNELYDLQADPNEQNNLYGKAEYKEVQDRLQQQLDRFRQEQQVDEW